MKKLILLISFFIGLTVVGMEIVGARLLAPDFGTSIFVWSNIIAVVLLSLSIGYFFGGKVAEKQGSLDLLTKLCLVAGLFFLFVPKLSSWIIGFGNSLIFSHNNSNFGFFLTTFIVSFILFGLPLILLGMTSPLIVKLYNAESTKVGESAGIVFAVSTLGSILGTMIPTFWMIPILGTSKTIVIFGIILILIGLLTFGAKRLIITMVVVGAASLTTFLPSQTFAYKIVYQTESPYHHIKVVEDPEQNRYLVFGEGLSLESIYKRDGEILTGAFYDYFNFLPLLNKPNENKKVLVLGLAGATIPRQLNYFYPERVTIDAVEIDKKVIDVANEYFDLNQLKLNVIEADGRIFLKQSNLKYDIIMIDVFQNELYIPWTFTTKEFWELVSQRLADDGLVAINVHAASNKSLILDLILNTQAAVFENVYLTDYMSGRGTSYILTSSKIPVGFTVSQELVPKELVPLGFNFSKTRKIGYDAGKGILTDDWAPIEMLTEHSVESYRKQKLFK